MVEEALLSAVGVLFEELLVQKLDEKLEPVHSGILKLQREMEGLHGEQTDHDCVKLEELERRVHAIEVSMSEIS